MAKVYTGPQMSEAEADFAELVDEVVDCAGNLTSAYEWGVGTGFAERALREARENLMKAYQELAHGISTGS
jgi:hypothetical protein